MQQRRALSKPECCVHTYGGEGRKGLGRELVRGSRYAGGSERWRYTGRTGLGVEGFVARRRSLDGGPRRTTEGFQQ